MLSNTPFLAPQSTIAKNLSETLHPVEGNGKRSPCTSNASLEEKPPESRPGCPSPQNLGISRNSPLLQAVALLGCHPTSTASGTCCPLGPLPPPVGSGISTSLQAVGCGTVVLGEKPPIVSRRLNHNTEVTYFLKTQGITSSSGKSRWCSFL